MRAFKAHLRGLSPYPYKKEEAPVKLDQNESPFDLPGALKEEALGRLRAIPWNRYPEIHAESLRKRLSALLDWPEEGIVLAPGSNLLILALSLAAEEVLDLRPSFPHYAHAAKVAGTPYRAVPLGEGFSLDLKALLAAFRGGVLFLPNPHAPTGALFPEEALRALAERAKEVGGLLVVDEAYREFAGTDFRFLARENPHVALLRTFSKAFSLGGVRAGYLLGSPEVAGVVREVLPPSSSPPTPGPSWRWSWKTRATWRRWWRRWWPRGSGSTGSSSPTPPGAPTRAAPTSSWCEPPMPKRPSATSFPRASWCVGRTAIRGLRGASG